MLAFFCGFCGKIRYRFTQARRPYRRLVIVLPKLYNKTTGDQRVKRADKSCRWPEVGMARYIGEVL